RSPTRGVLTDRSWREARQAREKSVATRRVIGSGAAGAAPSPPGARHRHELRADEGRECVGGVGHDAAAPFLAHLVTRAARFRHAGVTVPGTVTRSAWMCGKSVAKVAWKARR